MSFYADDVLGPMLAAAEGSLANDWKANAPAVKQQLQDLASQVEVLTKAVADGKIPIDSVAEYFDLEKQATISVMAELQGIGKVAAEKAVNAALGAISSVINGAVGFALI